MRSGSVSAATSVALFICCLFNPAVLSLAHLLHHTGFFFAFLFLIAVAFVGLIVSTALCDMVGRVRGNFAYVKHIELSQILVAALGPRWQPLIFIAVHGFFTVLQSVYILILANLIDALIIIYAKRAIALEWFVADARLRMQVTSAPQLDPNPFTQRVSLDLDRSHTPFVITSGYVVAGLLLVPLSLTVTRVSTVASFATVGVSAIAALLLLLLGLAVAHPETVHENFHHTPVLGDVGGMVVDTPILLSLFSVTAFIPSWLNVRIRRQSGYVRVWTVLAAAFGVGVVVVMLSCMLFGAIAKPSALDPELSILLVAPNSNRFTLVVSVLLVMAPFIVVYLWLVCVFSTSLAHSGILRPSYASAAVRVVPWLFCWVGARSSLWYASMTWAVVALNGLACFVLPMIAFVAVSSRLEQRTAPFVEEPHYGLVEDCCDDHRAQSDDTDSDASVCGSPGHDADVLDLAPLSPSVGMRGIGLQRGSTMESDTLRAAEPTPSGYGALKVDEGPSRIVLSTVPEVTFLSERNSQVVSPALVGTFVLAAVCVWLGVCWAGAVFEYAL